MGHVRRAAPLAWQQVQPVTRSDGQSMCLAAAPGEFHIKPRSAGTDPVGVCPCRDGVASCKAIPVRILLVSQMYPGPDDPDLGVFVAQLEQALRERGHELERAVIDRRGGGKLRHVALALDARAAARR